MQVPYDRLQPETLTNLIEEFVTRDGTDYGSQEVSIAAKIAQVRKQLERGEAVIVFDEESETCNIVLKRDAAARLPTSPSSPTSPTYERNEQRAPRESSQASDPREATDPRDFPEPADFPDIFDSDDF